VLPEKLQYVAIMNKAWAEKNGVPRRRTSTPSRRPLPVRNANGTGPMRLERYEPDVRTLLRRHDGWWGWGDKRSGNLEAGELRHHQVRRHAAGRAGLGRGRLVLDPPYQDIQRLKADPRITLLQTPDIGQQYLAFDQARDELQDSDVKGRNPFKDLRVRKAVYHAINVPLIIDKVLRGQAAHGRLPQPAGGRLARRTGPRLPYDPARSRQLLGEAGYPNGFSVTLDCVNVAWRENVCQAVAAMLTQVGIRTTLRSSPSNQFFPKLSQGTASFVEFGWTASPDAWNSLNGLFRSFDRSGLGTFNAGRYSNAKLDSLIDSMRTEPDLTRRRAMVSTVLRMVADELPLVPLYRRTLTWAMAKPGAGRAVAQRHAGTALGAAEVAACCYGAGQRPLRLRKCHGGSAPAVAWKPRPSALAIRSCLTSGPWSQRERLLQAWPSSTMRRLRFTSSTITVPSVRPCASRP
jgi:peptide/nickel transport system substrate-binding protein